MLDLQVSEHTITSADDAPIFIIGTGRSGTTLLRQMMNAHPRIHVTHEACFYSAARHAPKESSVSEWLERYFETASFAWLRLDPALVRAALPKDLSRAHITDVYRAIMREKARQRGKVRYGEKNPLDTHNLAQIFSDFKDPRVIFIMRDPRPTVLSFNRMPFGTTSALLNSFICRVQCEHIKPFRDRILEVKLEDLARDGRAVMGAILRYVGEPWDDAVLDPVQHSAVDDVPPLPWFQGATRELPNQRQSAGGWQTQMDPAWIRWVESINKDAMAYYGYAPAQLEREPGFFALTAAILRDVPGWFSAAYRLLAFKRKIDRHFQGKERLDPQRGMEENLALNPPAWRHYPGFQMPQVPRLPAHT